MFRRGGGDTGADYRADYPGQKLNNLKLNDNVLFYRGELRDRPNKQLISDYHTSWRGDYENLEASHCFIQWLFPIHEPGRQVFLLFSQHFLSNTRCEWPSAGAAAARGRDAEKLRDRSEKLH